MTINSYLDISLNSQTFYINESTKKSKKRHNAISTLEKIEQVLKESLKYSPTFSVGHSLHKMTKAESICFLQKEAKRIHKGYTQKQSKLCWLWRKVFSKKKKADAIYKRIAKFTPMTTNALPIIPDCIPSILEYLPTSDLLTFSQVNSNAKAHADLALRTAVRKLGCKDQTIPLIKKYLKSLCTDLKLLSKKNWKYGPKKNVYFRNLIVRNAQGKISIEESLDRLKQLPVDDLAKLFVHKAQFQLLKKVILTPSITTGGTFSDQKTADLALCLAVRNKELEVVKFLLSHGANANLTPSDISCLVKTPTEETLLSLSIKQKTPGITHLLLQANATIAPNLLHVAVRVSSNHRNIKLLLKYGADVDQLDDKGKQAILNAIKNKDLDNVRALIEDGAKHCYTNEILPMALFFAVQYGTPEIIKLLIQHGADPYKTPQGLNSLVPFFCAIINEDVAKILAFIEEGVNLNYAWGRGGLTPLTSATLKGSPEVIKLLIRHGADPYEDDSNSCSLFGAIIEKNIAIVRAFIEEGFDLNRTNKFNETPLQMAVKHGTPEMIKLLIKHGASLYEGSPPNFFDSPIFVAIANKQLASVLAFIEGGIDLSYTDQFGKQLLAKAIEYDAIEIAKVLIQHRPDLSQWEIWQDFVNQKRMDLPILDNSNKE